MVRQKEILISSEETKTGSCNNCGQKQRLATSWEDVEGEAERLLESARANEQDSEDRGRTQGQIFLGVQKALRKLRVRGLMILKP